MKSIWYLQNEIKIYKIRSTSKNKIDPHIPSNLKLTNESVSIKPTNQWARRRTGPFRFCPRTLWARSWASQWPARTWLGRGNRNPEASWRCPRPQPRMSSWNLKIVGAWKPLKRKPRDFFVFLIIIFFFSRQLNYISRFF